MNGKPLFWPWRTFSQKVAWRCRHPDPWVDYRTWVDKHLVKEIVRPYFRVAETHAVTAHPEGINCASLPATFVMKASHSSGMFLLVTDGIARAGDRGFAGVGRSVDSDFLQQVARGWFDSAKGAKRLARERHYRCVQPGILIEQFVDPVDYELQLFLFNGRFRFALVLYHASFHNKGSSHRLYDERWRLLEPGSVKAESRYEWAATETPRPPAALLKILEVLCRTIDHVRADFLVRGEEYYFSEFTFTDYGGKPGLIGKYDAYLGRFWSR
jgi:hypothetical protein